MEDDGFVLGEEMSLDHVADFWGKGEEGERGVGRRWL